MSEKASAETGSVQVQVNISRVEDVCDQLCDLQTELCERAGLNGMERWLVAARLSYIYEQGIARLLTGSDRTNYDRVRAIMIERAEQIRADNTAADALGVNTSGGSA